MPRASATSKVKSRHDPLHVQIGEDEAYSKFGRVSTSKRGKKRGDENENELDVIKFANSVLICLYVFLQMVLDVKTSRKIFDLAKDQQEELDLVDDEGIDESNSEEDAQSNERMDSKRIARAPLMQDSDEDEDENEYPDEEYEELVRLQVSTSLVG
jgi:essential nuclear protein 1